MDKVIKEDPAINETKQLWMKEESDIEGFFKLKSFESGKFLRAKVNDPDDCVEATISPITRYLTLGTLVLLIIWEFLQFLSKAFTREILEYFSWQNVLEVALLGLSS